MTPEKLYKSSMWVCDICGETRNEEVWRECMSCSSPKPKSASSSSGAGKRARVGQEDGKSGPGACAWRVAQSVLQLAPSAPLLTHPRETEVRVAAFDLDGTLVVPKSGAKFAKNKSDWTWFDARVPDKLRELSAKGFHIVIFSNQNGVETGKTSTKDLEEKLTTILSMVGLDTTAAVFMATEKDQFRKPGRKMWDQYAHLFLSGGAVPSKDSFYCGDAAGRFKDWIPGKPKDFASSDRKFAANIGLNFLTPEELFLGIPATTKWAWGSLDPKVMIEKFDLPKKPVIEVSKSQELVVFVGSPASGKSRTATKVFETQGYVRVNNDEMKTKQKCMKVATAALQQGKSVVVDNTNPDPGVRAEWISLAKSNGVKTIRCLYFSTPRDICDHLNLYREMVEGRPRVPGVALNTFNSRFVMPTEKEGFASVQHVQFVLQFASEQEKKLFQMWF